MTAEKVLSWIVTWSRRVTKGWTPSTAVRRVPRTRNYAWPIPLVLATLIIKVLRVPNIFHSKYRHIKAKTGRNSIALWDQMTVLQHKAAVSLLPQMFIRGKRESQHTVNHCLLTSTLSITGNRKPVPLGKSCSYLIRLQKSKMAEVDRIKILKRLGYSCQTPLL